MRALQVRGDGASAALAGRAGEARRAGVQPRQPPALPCAPLTPLPWHRPLYRSNVFWQGSQYSRARRAMEELIAKMGALI